MQENRPPTKPIWGKYSIQRLIAREYTEQPRLWVAPKNNFKATDKFKGPIAILPEGMKVRQRLYSLLESNERNSAHSEKTVDASGVMARMEVNPRSPPLHNQIDFCPFYFLDVLSFSPSSPLTIHPDYSPTSSRCFDIFRNRPRP